MLSSCLAHSPSSLLIVWFLLFPMALAFLLAWNKWKGRSTVQDTSDEIPLVVGRHQDPYPSSFPLLELGSSPCSFSGPGEGKCNVWLGTEP